jgi:putative DNA primase/helicase
MATTNMMAAALELAAKGFCVFPVVNGDKKPLVKWKEGATKDESIIKKLWLQHPDANIGVIAGKKSGFWAIDVDNKNGINGFDSLKEYAGTEAIFDEEKYLCATTPSGGKHFLFAWDDELDIPNPVGILPGIDIRSEGGYIVVAPSSVDINGIALEYQWNDLSLPLAPINDWSLQLAQTAIAAKKTKQPYVKTRVTNPEVPKLIEGIGEGNRDNALYRYAQFLRRQEMPFDLAIAFIKEAAARCVPPFCEETAKEKVCRAYTSVFSEQSEFEYTDLGNAKRWAHLYDQEYRWIPELKAWFKWNGSLWEEDKLNTHMQTVDKVIEDIKQESYRLSDAVQDIDKTLKESAGNQQNIDVNALEKKKDKMTSQQKQCAGWAKESQKGLYITSMIKLAKARPSISHSMTEFDQDGVLLGLENGVMNLKTKEFIQNCPSHLITKSAGTYFDEEATCPNWLKLLDTVFEGDSEVIAFIQRIFGQCLLGTPDKNKLFIFSGSGANGKSTIVDTMNEVIGDYSRTTSSGAITANKTNKEYYLAELVGARMTIINESKKGAKLDEELTKMLVDSGVVQARKIFSSPIYFQPVATPILTTNYPPAISADYSINRRLCFVPFEYKIPEEEREPNFRENHLVPEHAGILNWALEGCYKYLENGLNPPKKIVDATNLYIFDNDKVSQFVEECCDEDLNFKVESIVVHQKFTEWCKSRGLHPFSQKRLNNELRQHDFEVGKSTEGRYYVFGLQLRTDVNALISSISSEESESDQNLVSFN